MDDLASAYDNMEEQGMAMAEVDCSTERAICAGEHWNQRILQYWKGKHYSHHYYMLIMITYFQK